VSASASIAKLTANWQEQLRNVITSGTELLNALDLTPAQAGFSEAACADFAVKVPHSFVRRMQRGDPCDPLLLQVISRSDEMLDTPGYTEDPVGEAASNIALPGLIHKYRGRVLLIVAGGCVINCRYCFRRHFPYEENRNSKDQWSDALQYIQDDSSIREVILSGGDPLVATDAHLAQLVQQIGAIGHVKRLRIHSRVPVVLPDRVTPDLLNALRHEQLQTIMVLHCNHANEIDASVADAVAAMRKFDFTVLNQAVLLAGVNANLQAQSDLCEALFTAGILPYYLHLLDRVQGAAHFDIPEEKALALHRELTARLPGYMVPKLVREIAGADAKTGVGGTA
jgi:EF-P beta-lysylation protein EpmB